MRVTIQAAGQVTPDPDQRTDARLVASRALAAVLGALAGLLAAALIMLVRQPSTAEQIAQAIESGRAPQSDPGAYEAQNGDTGAGYLWAVQHALTNPTECPTSNSKAFRDGCVARAGQQASRSR